MDATTFGVWCGILSAVAYAGANFALRDVADRHRDLDWAVWISCLKAVPAVVVCWAIIAYRASRGLPALPARRKVLPLVLTGLYMQFGGNVLFQLSLSLGGLALTVSLVFSTLIISGALCGKWFLGESVSPRSWLAMSLLMASIAALSLGAQAATVAASGSGTAWSMAAAVLASLIAGVAYGASGVMIRGTVQNASLSATLVWLSTSGAVGLGLMALVRMGPSTLAATPLEDLWMMLAAGVMNAVAFFAVGAAFRYISIVQVNLLNASQTAICAIGGVILFSEPPTVWLIAGTALTIVGLMLMDRNKKCRVSRVESRETDTPAPSPIDS